MQYQVTVICDSREEALAFLQGAASVGLAASPAGAAGEPEKPKRGRKAAATETQPAAAAPSAPSAPPVADPMNILGLPAAATPANPLESLLGPGTSAGQLPPVATAPPAPLAPPPAVQQAPQSSLTQQQVIQAFVALGQAQPPKGGIDVVKAVLAQLGVATVTAVQPAQYAQAVELVKARFNA